jgi:hypothetical protein
LGVPNPLSTAEDVVIEVAAAVDAAGAAASAWVDVPSTRRERTSATRFKKDLFTSLPRGEKQTRKAPRIR